MTANTPIASGTAGRTRFDRARREPAPPPASMLAKSAHRAGLSDRAMVRCGRDSRAPGRPGDGWSRTPPTTKHRTPKMPAQEPSLLPSQCFTSLAADPRSPTQIPRLPTGRLLISSTKNPTARGWRIVRLCTCSGISRESKEFLLRGLQVRILLGSPVFSEPSPCVGRRSPGHDIRLALLQNEALHSRAD